VSYLMDWIGRQSRLLVIALAPLLVVEYKTHQKTLVDAVTLATFVLALWLSLPTRRATQSEVEGAARRLKGLVRDNWISRRQVLQGDLDGANVPYIRRQDCEDPGLREELNWPPEGTHFNLYDSYRGIRAGRLLIIGKPGSGKSIAAYTLVIDILERGLGEPFDKSVPIPVAVIGWDGEKDLSEWLIGQIVDGYRIVRPVARRLVKEGYILPVLDGLNEVDADAGQEVSSRIMEKLNESADARAIAQGALIVTCQSGAYRSLSDDGLKIKRAVVIEMKNLPANDIRSYMRMRLALHLKQSPSEMAKLDRVVAQDDSCLVRTLGQPLMLNLAINVITSGISTASQLARFRRESMLSRHLIKAIIPAAIETTSRYPLPRILGDARKPVLSWWYQPKPYTADEVRAWLTIIAVNTSGKQRTRAVFQPGNLWLLADEAKVRFIHFVLAMTLGLLVAGLAAEAQSGPVGGVLTAFTALVALLFACWAGFARRPSPRRLNFRQYATAAGLARLLAVAALGGLCAIGGAYDGGPSTAVTSGIGGALAFAVVIGLTANIALIMDPRRSLRDDLLFGSLFGLGVSIAAALPHGLSGGIAAGLSLNKILSVPGSAALAIVIAMTGGVVLGSHVWTRYALMIIMVAPSRRVPWRLMHFIKWCYAANLLRMSGTSFELRHEEILKALD
jgi:NACHT domain